MFKNKKRLILLLICLLALFLTGCAKEEYMEAALSKETFGFWDIFVYPMAGIMWLIANSVGFHNYAVTIIISTLIVRTMAWPIYAKTNDLQLKMKLVQPEMNKIQAKYADKKDQESQQRMQMETMQLYKKYGIGIGGCIMPIIQTPIFLGFYYTIRKIPACITAATTAGGSHWLGNAFVVDGQPQTTLFGVDMILEHGDAGWNAQFVGVIVLCVLVGFTQLLSIFLSNRRQKKAKENTVSEIPEYRRPQQTEQQKSSENMMKIMLYGMAVLMVVFVWRSPAGLGLYWTVGNVYSTLQSWLGEKQSEKRLAKLKNKIDKGIIK